MRDNQEYWYLDYLLFGEARTDNAYAGTTGAEVVPVETNALDASNPDIARDWNGYLNDIAHANVVIANIDQVPDPSFSEQERKQWKSEALIFRAMMIFDLARWFGNIPLNLTEAPDITADNIEEVYPLYFPSPVTQDSAYRQVIKDLEEALPYAPALDANDKRKLSKTVARALLTKVYAELGEWDNVVRYADEVFAFGIRQQLEQFRDGDSHTVVARTSVGILRLVLAVLRRTEFILVGLLFLAFNRVLLVDGSEQQIQRFADEGLT